MVTVSARTRACVLLLLVLAVALVAPTSRADAATRTSGVFADDDGSVHEPSIEALAVAGVTHGCALGRFCPDRTITREQMAAFVVRAIPQPRATRDWFVDDDGSIHEPSIDRLREGGITRGCNPPRFTRYCPGSPVTRGQLAVFLTEALDLPPSGRDAFADDDGHQFEQAIQALRAAGITLGCNPPSNTRFCPDQAVSRAQMATFLARALALRQQWPLDGRRCPVTGMVCDPADRTHPVGLRWDGLDLRLPSSAVELVGFHQSNHDGARTLSDLGAAPSVVMASRGRGTGSRTAADVVAHPRVEVRAPVTGRVLRSGTYTLYCRYGDGYVVVEPAGRPGLEVKLVHVTGVLVRPGDRVEAGVTVVARRPTVLPFASQVDDHSRGWDWPHVHLEVVDTSIPDRPGGGC